MQRRIPSIPTIVSLVVFMLFALSLSRHSQAEEDKSAERTEEIILHNNRGVAFMEQLKFEDAGAEFRKILELDPQFVPAQVNLGLAYFNLQRYEEAVSFLRRALELDGEQLQAHFVLGLIYRNHDKVDQALEEFLEVSRQDPHDPFTNYYLGLLYSRQKEYERAVRYLQIVVASEPYNASAHYNLAIAFLRSGKREEGQGKMEEFRRLQDQFGTTTVGLQYLEQGKYALVIERIPIQYLRDVDHVYQQGPIEVVFTEVAAAAGLSFQHVGAKQVDFRVKSRDDLGEKIAPYLGSGLSFGDYDNDGWLDLFVGNAGPEDVQNALFHNRGDATFEETTMKAELHFRGKTMMGLWGDFNNDDYADLYLVNYGPNVLYQNQGDGTFADVTNTAGVADASWGLSGVFVDYDHDGDLDIFVANFIDPSTVPFGGVDFPNGFSGAQNTLYRNNGDGTFADVSQVSRLDGGNLKSLGVICTDFDNSRDIDFYVVNLGAPNQLFSNLRNGSFVNLAQEMGLNGKKWGAGPGSGDINGDGFMDLALPHWHDLSSSVLVNQGGAGYKSLDLPVSPGNAHSAIFLDFDNDGDQDILLVAAPLFEPSFLGQNGGRNLYLLENREGKFQDISEETNVHRFHFLAVRGASVADFDNDGDLDFAVNVNGASPLLLRNDGGNKNNWLTVQTAGTNSNKPGIGSKVEIKSGRLYQKREIYGGQGFLSQSPPLAHFGLGRLDRVDTVRMLWPGGVLQSEMQQPINRKLVIQELDRKGTSCPLLYVWDGKGYRFQTDFLGGSAYGYLLAPGIYNHPDTDEYIKLDPAVMAPKDGKLAITLNNQLEEVILFDQLELVVVDHPFTFHVFPEEKLLPGPPYADFRLLTLSEIRPLLAAEDGRGRNILPEINRVDRIFPDGFQKLPFKGYAETHQVVLDLGPISTQYTALLMHAWIDYADSTSNLAASQAGLKLVPPYLQVQDSRGQWVTVIERMGFPAGLPKTMTVDLSNKFLSDSHKVRIVTNMQIYWDQIVVGTGTSEKNYTLWRLQPDYADLHFRGFPMLVSRDGRKPFLYDYEQISPTAQWKAHIGGYTRYGDVLPLLLKRDDMFVITRSGDEIEAMFDLSRLPDLPSGWVRDYLIYVDGFGKDMDPNSARSDYIEPLPFHAMSIYPYPEHEHYPRDKLHQRYLQEWNTRTVEQWFPGLKDSPQKP